MKLDEYDMITLCIDRVEDRTRGGYYLNWILDGRYYIEIIWFLPTCDRWLADRRRREVTTT
jgi:hypothetical protein